MIPLGVLGSARHVTSGGLLPSVTDVYSSQAAQTTYSFTADIGQPSPNRTVLVGSIGTAGGSRVPASATINGVSGSDAVTPSGGWFQCGVSRLPVPTGNTALIEITFNGVMNGCSLIVWTIDSLLTKNSHNDYAPVKNPALVTIPTVAGGFTLAAAFAASADTYPWSIPTVATGRAGMNRVTYGLLHAPSDGEVLTITAAAQGVAAAVNYSLAGVA